MRCSGKWYNVGVTISDERIGRMKSYKTKGVMLTLAALCAAAMGAVDSRSYVQSGLVNQWDGIDNAGIGTHVASTNIWKDLAGNIDLTLKGSGAWNAAGTGLSVSKLSAQGTKASSAYRTIAVAYKMTSSGGRILFTSGCTSGANGTYYPRAMYFDANGTKGYFDGSNRDTLYVPWTFNASAFRTMAGVYNSSHGISRIYGDGVKVTSGVTLKNSWLSGDGKVSIGNRATGDSYSWYGEVYTIRLYSRDLTELELRRNNRIDLLRFNGGVGVDDAAITGGELQFKVAASAQGNGMVSVAGGAAAASASTWAADGATVVIEAVPASGSTFVGWIGDTSTAEISGATATVSATAPMNITSIFADGSPLTVSVYT